MTKHDFHIRSILIALALFCGIASSVWAATIFQQNFESTPIGPLGSPWTITSAGSGSVSVVNTSDHGHILQLRGSTTEGDFLIASRRFSSSSSDITTQVDIKPSSGSAFLWILNGAGSSIGKRRIRLQQAPGTTTLVASTAPSGNTNCGTIPSGVWSHITLRVHSAQAKFDVLINGKATACTGISAGIQPPFNSVSVMDASNAGWGGTVLFDNIVVTSP